MRGLYFSSYAIMATLSLIIIGWAQFRRKKREGIPINLAVLKAIAAIALAMWIGAVMSVVGYQMSGADQAWGESSQTTNTIFIVASVIGAIFVGIFCWQMLKVSRELDRNRRELKDLAARDALTNSWNRRIFHENLNTEVKSAAKTTRPLSLLMFDVDNFTKLNEEHGYTVGDGIIRELVSRIMASTQLSNTVYRYEDDDIALLMPGTDEDTAQKEAARMAKILSDKPYDFGEHGTITIRVSIGVSSYGEASNTPELMIESAIEGVANAKIK